MIMQKWASELDEWWIDSFSFILWKSLAINL